jgi:hypothetical protein
VTAICTAIVPGWRGAPLPMPRLTRAALLASVAVAHALAWAWYRRPLRRVAPALVERLAHHAWWPLRALVQWWKLVALVTSC